MTQLDVRREGAVLVVTFANPPEGFMDRGTEAELEPLLAQVDADDECRAVVFTGGLPGVFIRHYSVQILEDQAREMSARGLKFAIERPVPESPVHRIFRGIANSPKPFIAAINGTAMGGGFELALACDIRVAEAGPYSLGLPEVNIGILPGAGGTQRLAQLVGPDRALEMIMRGRTVSPHEAARLGMVHECVEGSALDRALEVAQELANKVPAALAHVKYLIRVNREAGLAAGLAAERTLFCDLMVNPDSIERMAQMNRGKRDIRDR